jgi:hypothetical protein
MGLVSPHDLLIAPLPVGATSTGPNSQDSFDQALSRYTLFETKRLAAESSRGHLSSI